jgi:hypothetical protein
MSAPIMGFCAVAGQCMAHAPAGYEKVQREHAEMLALLREAAPVLKSVCMKPGLAIEALLARIDGAEGLER